LTDFVFDFFDLSHVMTVLKRDNCFIMKRVKIQIIKANKYDLFISCINVIMSSFTMTDQEVAHIYNRINKKKC
jgi:hypothetical protein